jgi:hypothetical protein
LLPTPSAYESTPTDEFSDEVRESLTDPHKRLYLPGRKWHAQRTLARMAGALFPTPTGDDANNVTRESGDFQSLARETNRLLPTPNANEGRAAKDFDPDSYSKSGRSLPTLARAAGEDKLLPTPVVTDSYGSRRSTARTDAWTSNEGTSLTDAIWETQGRETDTKGNLLPTPLAGDMVGGTGPKSGLRTQARIASGQADPEAPTGKLLPTPMANPENPGAGGELRAAIVHGEERRNETGVDTMGRPNLGRPSTGEPTQPPSVAGKSSRDQHPDQLTIGDA